MDGCIQGELHDDDRKAATALQVSREFCQNVGGLGFMGKVFWDQIFGKSDESLVRLAKAFAGKSHASCVRIRIRDVGKGSLSKRRYPYVTIIGLVKSTTSVGEAWV
jgi:hypothetical protein